MKLPPLFLTLALLLSACVNEPGVVSDVHTGKNVTHSKRYEIGKGLLHNTHARAGYSNKNGYSVVIEHLATGGDWMHFAEAWSFGKKFTFVAAEGELLGCSSGCTFYEGGAIRMAEEDFRAYAKSGFSFALIGTGGRVEGVVPAAAFQEVLGLKGG